MLKNIGVDNAMESFSLAAKLINGDADTAPNSPTFLSMETLCAI